MQNVKHLTADGATALQALASHRPAFIVLFAAGVYAIKATLQYDVACADTARAS